jgi:hypothetical protein
VLEAGFRLLAVADDVDPEFTLLPHRACDRFTRFAPERIGIEWLPAHPRQQQGRQRCPPGEASGVGREDTSVAVRESSH